MFGGKALSAFGYEINMWAFAENLASRANWIAQTFDTTDATATEGRPVHDESVELNFSIAVEEAAAAGVEGFVIFHYDDGFFDRVERGTAAFEGAPSGASSVAHTVEVRLDHVVGNGPRTAMYDQNRIGWHLADSQESCGD